MTHVKNNIAIPRLSYNAIDNGSTSTDVTIRLLIENDTILTINEGFILNFQAPFTATAQEIKTNLSYEIIELSLQNGATFTNHVKRAPYTSVNEDGIYEDNIKDNRPTFVQGRNYFLFFHKGEWINNDNNLPGTVLFFASDDHTPAGYKDLAYNYNTIDYNKYPFLRVYDPRLSNINFAMSKTNLAMMPEHTHTWQANYHEQTGSGGDCADNKTYSAETVGVNGLNTEKGQVGDDLFPSNLCLRLIEKML
ncbi:hypothetical protein HAV_00023 [Candidatus Hepatincola sp. Av]